MNKPFSWVRSFSSSQCRRLICWPKHEYGPLEVQRTTLMNGTKIASAKPMGAQIGACTIMFQAGSRYEMDDQLGATHFIRSCSAMSGCGYTSFFKTRMLQQMGGYITCSSDRQSIAFTLRCPNSVFKTLIPYFLDMVARCCYLDHDVVTRKPSIKEDLDRIPPEQRVLDLVQTACFSGPLSQSIFCAEDRIKTMRAADMNWFAASNFRPDGCAVTSVGMPFEAVVDLAEKVELRREKPPPRCTLPSYPRAGFELYDLGPNSDTWIAVAVPGCGTADLNCLMQHNIVAAACGTGDMGRGQHSHDRSPETPLGQLLGSDTHGYFRAFNISYNETGVFGILAKTRSCTAYKAAFAAADFLKNIHALTATQLEIGKQRLKLDISIHDDDCVRMSEGLALQCVNGHQVDSAAASLDMLSGIASAQVCNVSQMLSNKTKCQMAVAVVGDLQAVPHDRELTGY